MKNVLVRATRYQILNVSHSKRTYTVLKPGFINDWIVVGALHGIIRLTR